MAEPTGGDVQVAIRIAAHAIAFCLPGESQGPPEASFASTAKFPGLASISRFLVIAVGP